LAPERQFNEAVLVTDYVLQMTLLLGTRMTGLVQAVTQYGRRYHQSDFIHKGESEKTLAQHRSSHELDVSVSRRENLIDQLLEIT